MAKITIDTLTGFDLSKLDYTSRDKLKKGLPSVLDKFAKAMGVALDVDPDTDTDTGVPLMNGKPGQVYMATMIERTVNNAINTSIVLFAKPLASDQPIPYYGTYQPRKLVDKSTIDGLSNKMFSLRWRVDGKAVNPTKSDEPELQTVSIVPLVDNERDAVARQLRREYRVDSDDDFDNRFVVLNTCNKPTHFPGIADYECYYDSHISDIMPIEDVYGTDVCIDDTMTLFDRQNVDKVFKMVTSQRGSDGRVREVVQYCMEPVLCASRADHDKLHSWLVFEYLKQSKCDDERLFDQITKYQSRIQGSYGLPGVLYPRETMMSWLHLDI